MKKYFLVCALLFGIVGTTLAQRTPQPSPGATIKQTVGITDFTVTYSRPSLKGRQAFGPGTPLGPTGEVWRTGANAATTLEAATDFTFGGKKVPAGKYALFSIPAGGSWTVMLNANFKDGIGGYSKSNDVASISVNALSGPATETFTIGFADLTDSTATLTLSWAGVVVPVKLEVATTSLTTESIKKAVAEKPEDPATLQMAAGYMLNKGQNLDQALAMADKSIGLKETFNNLWLKAQILSKLGKVGEAIPVAQKALTVGEASGNDAFKSFYKGQIEAGLNDWKTKLPSIKK